VNSKFWTETKILGLRRLWGTGIVTNEIGRLLGCSKASVTSMAHRLKLPSRPSPIVARSPDAPRHEPWAPRVTGPTLPPLPSERLAAGLPAASWEE